MGDKYYLYAAHSERVKGSGKIKRVCDGYLGRITELAKPVTGSPSVRTLRKEFGWEFEDSLSILLSAFDEEQIRNALDSVNFLLKARIPGRHSLFKKCSIHLQFSYIKIN